MLNLVLRPRGPGPYKRGDHGRSRTRRRSNRGDGDGGEPARSPSGRRAFAGSATRSECRLKVGAPAKASQIDHGSGRATLSTPDSLWNQCLRSRLALIMTERHGHGTVRLKPREPFRMFSSAPSTPYHPEIRWPRHVHATFTLWPTIIPSNRASRATADRLIANQAVC